MNRLGTYVIVLFAATTVGGAILAWRQYGELVELRAAAMKRDERAELQKRVWDLEKRNRELQGQAAAGRSASDGKFAAEGAPSRPAGRREGEFRGGPGDPRDRGMQQMNAFRELMNKPEVQAMVSLQQRAEIDRRYAPLFKNLNLPVEQIEKLKSLLAERTTTMQDVMAASAEQGINPRDNPDAFRKLITNAQNEINASIRATIGDTGFAQLTGYEQTLPQRQVVNELQQRLSYTNSPLTPAQADQLVGILAANPPPKPNPPPSGQPAAQPGTPQSPGNRDAFRGPGGGGFDLGALVMTFAGGSPGMGPPPGGPDGGGRAGPPIVTSAAVNQAQGVLAPPQVAALQQIQQQQQTQQQLKQLITDTLSAGQSTNSRGAPAGPNGTSNGGENSSRKRGPGGE